VSYFAVALARTEAGWTGEELDLDDVTDLEALTDVLRDLTGDGPGPGCSCSRRTTSTSPSCGLTAAAAAWPSPGVPVRPARGAAERRRRHALGGAREHRRGRRGRGHPPVAEPVGEAGLLADLGTTADELLALCAEEGRLPADVLTEVCERAGCLDVLEELREG
jgi:hypothetical protein